MESIGGQFRVKSENDIITLRQAVRETARSLGFGPADQTRLVTAVSELAHNVIEYAREGVCRISDISDAKEIGIQVVVEDRGPGITDINKAVEYSYNKERGIGAGLPGIKNLVSKFDIESGPQGTKITIAITRPRNA